ncbi:hypothetical protein E3P99_02037 [Wallemia hederae]|uniref:Zinc/iron permease n=1 Tax=Wallemia hederae TaxID=1540922 RepID=A0A4T0FN21_9BASI|nr:hypothetical protein E3P99_02037 [Wallemia hederae]
MCPNVAKRIGAATYTTVLFTLVPTVLATNGRPSEDCSSEAKEEYDKGLHIAAIFIVLVSSALGITLPIFTKGLASGRRRARRVWDEAVFVSRYFGTGVIIATAFVHLLFEAFEQLETECIQLAYDPTAPAIAMASLFVIFVIDLAVARTLRKRKKQMKLLAGVDASQLNDMKISQQSSPEDPQLHDELQEKIDQVEKLVNREKYLDVLIIEGGIVFHSVMVGLGLGVTAGAGFAPYLIAIVFHQMCDGFAIGTRIADVKFTSKKYLRLTLMCSVYALITPIGIALGVICYSFFDANSPPTILAIGVLDSISAGLLIYGATVDLLAKDFFNGDGGLADASDKRVVGAILSMLLGAMVMSILGQWA